MNREEAEIGEERPTDYSLRFQESEDPELIARHVGGRGGGKLITCSVSCFEYWVILIIPGSNHSFNCRTILS